jgi:Fe-S-cluster containining protein
MTFKRTTCACTECVACCKRQAGALGPGDFERIAAALGEDAETAKAHFWASPGALVIAGGEMRRIGTITPRMQDGRCTFLGPDDRCAVHAVAPAGCALFDTHMGFAEARRRGEWLVVQQHRDRAYQQLRSELPPATSWRPKGY